jgi:hypothetical protein
MTLPPHKIGDRGQRYVFCVHQHYEGSEPEYLKMIYSDTASEIDMERMRGICDVHPVWHTPFIIDRHDRDAVVLGTRL